MPWLPPVKHQTIDPLFNGLGLFPLTAFEMVNSDDDIYQGPDKRLT
jgi:hypothetical protein